jgi:multicomponent Na+:H+ antiporter subunit D
MSGLPPLSGFFAKLGLLQAGLEVQAFWAVGVALVTSLLTLYSMTKIWTLGFWKPSPEEVEKQAGAAGQPAPPEGRAGWALWYAPMVLLAVVTLVMGFGAGLVFPVAIQAGQELIDSSGYIAAVFGSGE